MSILFNGAYANTKQQLWASYASNSGSSSTASNVYYENDTAGPIPTTIEIKLRTLEDYGDSPLLTILNSQRQVDYTTRNGNITFGVDSNITNYGDSFNIYSQDQYGIDTPLHIQGSPVYIQTNSQVDDRPPSIPSLLVSAWGTMFNVGGSPGTGLVINNAQNEFDSPPTYGTGQGTLYVADDGNLHWYNENTSSDNQITPEGSSPNIYNFTSDNSQPVIINATTNTDGSFAPVINVLHAVLENTTNGNASIFSIQYSAQTPYGGECDVVIMNQDLVNGSYYPIAIQTSGDPTGCLQINNPNNSSACGLFPDSLGNLHGFSQGVDEPIMGMLPLSYNGTISDTQNQALCPVILGSPLISPLIPRNVQLRTNAIVNISINGFVTSPTVGQDMITLGFNLIIYYEHISFETTINTTVSAYVSGVLMEPYPFSCSFSEYLNLTGSSGGGAAVYYAIEIIWVNGLVSGGDYTFNFQNINVTLTPQI